MQNNLRNNKMVITALLVTPASRTQMTENSIQQLQFTEKSSLNHRIIQVEMDLRRSVVLKYSICASCPHASRLFQQHCGSVSMELLLILLVSRAMSIFVHTLKAGILSSFLSLGVSGSYYSICHSIHCYHP